MTTTRPVVAGPRHAVSAGHYLAAAAGLLALEAGGNAIDAGVAAGLVLGVVQPDIVNVGGVAPILIRRADGRTESIAGLGHWPRSIPPDVFVSRHGGRMPRGVLRTVVPAAEQPGSKAQGLLPALAEEQLLQRMTGLASYRRSSVPRRPCHLSQEQDLALEWRQKVSPWFPCWHPSPAPETS